MAISFVSVKCPACGAALSVDSERELSFCSYCGSKIMMNNDNEYIYRNIDEARIKEAETERMIRLRELELEEKDNSRGRKGIYAAYGIALVFVIFGAIGCLFDVIAGLIGIMIGAYIAAFAFIKSDEKKKKKHTYVRTNEVQISDSMSEYENMNFQSVRLLFQGAGFTNVQAVPLNDLTIFNQKKNGQVESVTINGTDEFEEGDVYPQNSNVLITYHSKG